MNREQQAQLRRETEELEFYLSYLGFMGANKRRELIHGRPQYAIIFEALFNSDEFYDMLSDRLVQWGEGDRSLLQGENRDFIRIIWQRMKANQDYTRLDRFLQYLFNLRDDTLRGYLLTAGNQGGNDERVDINGILRATYPGVEERSLMERFLRRDLREADLRRLDQADRPVPLDENNDANVPAMQLRVTGFQRLEDAFVSMEVYTPEGEGNQAAILTSGSSDAEEEKAEQ